PARPPGGKSKNSWDKKPRWKETANTNFKRRFSSAKPQAGLRANRLPAALAGSNANAVFERKHEDFAVADLAGLRRACRMHNRFDRRLNKRLVDRNFQLQFRNEPNLEFGTAVDLGVP